MTRIARHLVPVYKPLVYITAILIMLFQSYVIWEDRITSVTWIEYSYRGTSCARMLDTCFLDADIKYINDIVEAQIMISDKTKQQDIVIHSFKRIYKDRNHKNKILKGDK